MRQFLGSSLWILGAMVACSSDDADSRDNHKAALPTVTMSETKTGDATYYDASGDGACMLGPSPDDLDVAALNQPDWGGSSLCGACAEVTGPKGTVMLRIVDLCPECAKGALDLSPQAFEKIAELSAGRVPVSWNLVTCNVSGPIRYRYKDGANQWWTAVQVRNHRVPVVALEFSRDGGEFQPMQRMDYNYFLTEEGFGPNPVRVRVTAMDGQTREDDLPAVQEDLVVEGHGQFD